MSVFKNFKPGHFYKLTAIIMIVVGIVPWESCFELDIRSDTFMMLNNGGLFWGGLILLQFIYILKFFVNECIGRAVRIILLIAGILSSSYCLYISNILQPNIWQDKAMYRNDDSYIILQFNSFGLLGEHTDIRLIETSNPDLPVRSIRIIKSGYALQNQFNLTEFGDFVKPIPALKWNKKTWQLVIP